MIGVSRGWGEPQELTGFCLNLGSRKLGLKVEPNDWQCPGRGLSELLIGVCDKLEANVPLLLTRRTWQTHSFLI